MTAVAAEEESIINDIFLIIKAVKEHLNEPNCSHKIRSIVKQALENKGAGVASQTPQTPIQTTEQEINQLRHVQYNQGNK